jgi:hypothetical protein
LSTMRTRLLCRCSVRCSVPCRYCFGDVSLVVIVDPDDVIQEIPGGSSNELAVSVSCGTIRSADLTVTSVSASVVGAGLVQLSWSLRNNGQSTWLSPSAICNQRRHHCKHCNLLTMPSHFSSSSSNADKNYAFGSSHASHSSFDKCVLVFART